LGNALEILAMTTKTVVYRMTKFMDQGIQKLNGFVQFGGNKNFIYTSTRAFTRPALAKSRSRAAGGWKAA
jgi:hypothetical protein